MRRWWLLPALLLAPALALAQNFGNIPPGTVLGNNDPTASRPASPIPMTGGRPAAVTCGASDVTAALQADINAYSAAGGGAYQMPVGKKCIVGTSVELVIPYNVQIVCAQNGGGSWPGHDYAAVADFLLNSAHMIRTDNANKGGRSGIFGCAIVRQGYTPVTSLRTSIQAAAAFAGTALQCVGTSDVSFDDNLIIGFAEAMSIGCNRFNARRNKMDSTNGITGVLCLDDCHIIENSLWTYATGEDSTVIFQDSTISNVTNQGGLFKVTLSAAPATPLVTGDRIVIHDAGGVPTANNRWIITVVDSTNFTLNTSTFAGAYTSGGKAFLSSYSRAGHAYSFGQGQWYGRDNISVGWDVGVQFTDSNEGSRCINCWVDGFQASKDPVPVAVLSTGTSGSSEFSGYLGAPARQISMQGTAGGEFLRLVSPYIVGQGVVVGGPPVINISHGALQIVGGGVFATPVNTNNFLIADAANYVRLSNFVMGSGNTAFQTTATGCPKLSVDGITGPCAFTPVIKGDGTAGTFTYTKQNGLWSRGPGGVDVNFELAWSAIPVAPTGTNTLISTLPVAPGVSPGTCTIGQTAGFSVSAGGIAFALGTSAGSTNATFTQTTNTGTLSAYAPTLLATNANIMASCRYMP